MCCRGSTWQQVEELERGFPCAAYAVCTVDRTARLQKNIVFIHSFVPLFCTLILSSRHGIVMAYKGIHAQVTWPCLFFRYMFIDLPCAFLRTLWFILNKMACSTVEAGNWENLSWILASLMSAAILRSFVLLWHVCIFVWVTTTHSMICHINVGDPEKTFRVSGSCFSRVLFLFVLWFSVQVYECQQLLCSSRSKKKNPLDGALTWSTLHGACCFEVD